MNLLVKWQKHENHEPLELLDIYVGRNYEYSEPNFYCIRVIGLLNDSNRKVEEFFDILKHHPHDQAFLDEMSEWLEFGYQKGFNEYAYYQDVGVVKKQDYWPVLDDLKQKCIHEYPYVKINFEEPSKKRRW